MILKAMLRQRAQPEGSMVERYLANKCLTFYSRYFEGVETLFNRVKRNDYNIPNKEKYLFNSGGPLIGAVESIRLDSQLKAQTHCYVLQCTQ